MSIAGLDLVICIVDRNVFYELATGVKCISNSREGSPKYQQGTQKPLTV